MKLLNGNQLKILACVFMAIDHIGYFLFPHVTWLRIVGRLALPIFAFLIAEGCYYTKRKYQHFAGIFLLGVVCQIGATIAQPGLKDLNILLTLSCSILMIYAMDEFKKDLYARKVRAIFSGLEFAAIVFVMWYLSRKFLFDYGFTGMILPVLPSLTYHFPECKAKKVIDSHYTRLVLLLIGALLLCIEPPLGKTQIYGVLALVLLFFYDGTRGKANLKYFFYIFYPAHIVIINAIAFLL